MWYKILQKGFGVKSSEIEKSNCSPLHHNAPKLSSKNGESIQYKSEKRATHYKTKLEYFKRGARP